MRKGPKSQSKPQTERREGDEEAAGTHQMGSRWQCPPPPPGGRQQEEHRGPQECGALSTEPFSLGRTREVGRDGRGVGKARVLPDVEGLRTSSDREYGGPGIWKKADSQGSAWIWTAEQAGGSSNHELLRPHHQPSSAWCFWKLCIFLLAIVSVQIFL